MALKCPLLKDTSERHVCPKTDVVYGDNEVLAFNKKMNNYLKITTYGFLYFSLNSVKTITGFRLPLIKKRIKLK